MTRILTLSLSLPAEQAVFKSLEAGLQHHPGVSVTTFDLLQFVKPSLKDMIWDRIASVSDYLPQSLSLGTLLEPDLEEVVNKISRDRLADAIAAEKPDLIVVASALAQSALAGMPARVMRDTATLALIGDYVVSRNWTRHQADLYVTSHPDLRESLAEQGVPMDRSVALGVMLPAGFGPVDRKALREAYRVSLPEQRMALIFAGGLGEDELEKLLFQLSLVKSPTTYYVATEGDKRVVQFVREKAPNYSVKAKMYHKTEKLGELIAASDVVIGRLGPLRMAETLARGVPVFSLAPPEKARRDAAAFVAAEGAGRVIENLYTLAAELDGLLGDEQRMTRFRDAARALGNPDASEAIVKQVVQAAAEKDRLVTQRKLAQPSRPIDDDDFEEVGEFSSEGFYPKNWSQDERARHLAQAIRYEKIIQRRLDDQQAQLKRWQERQLLAERLNRHDLVHQARLRVEAHRRSLDHLEGELKTANDTRQRIRDGQVVNSPFARGPLTWERQQEEDLEKIFGALEVDRDLEKLKRKLDDV